MHQSFNMRKGIYLFALLLVLSIIGIALLSIFLLQPPNSLPADSPASQFSAERAMQHLFQICKKPHAIGTTAHLEVRDYLLKTMQQLGLQPHIQEATVVNNTKQAAFAGYVYNILGRLKGNGDGKAILLIAHYDSQPNSLGAGDDGAGVVALLETARALQSGKPLFHDIVFLLTDGEEYGLFGAKAFLKHPWAKDIKLVMNLEGRGNAGPSITFEVNPDNGWVVEEFIKAAPFPVINSLSYNVYKRLPNNTDFTVFKDAGYTGLNSAFIDGFIHYHKLTDSPANLNHNSLQHHGSNLLSLTRHFANISLDNTKAPDKIFFNLIGNQVISYPAWADFIWLGLTTFMLTLAFMAGFRKSLITGKQVLAGFFFFLFLLIIVAVIFILLNKIVIRAMPFTHIANGVYGSDNFLVAYLLLATGIIIVLSRLALKWIKLFSLFMGVLVLWYILLIFLLIVMPDATYLAIFPLLFCVGGIWYSFLAETEIGKNFKLKYVVLQLLAVVPAIIILTPYIHLLFVTFALQLPVASMVLFSLLIGLLLPLLSFIDQTYSWRTIPLFPVTLLLTGSILLMVAVRNEAPSKDRPMHSHLGYYYNADNDSALWASGYHITDDWNKQFFQQPGFGTLKDFYPVSTSRYLINNAKPITSTPPLVQVMSDSIAGEERLLRLRLFSPRGAAHMEFVLMPQERGSIRSVALNEEKFELTPMETGQGEAFYCHYAGLPVTKDGILELRIKKGSRLNLLLYDQSIGLPTQLITRPTPEHIVPEQGRSSNITVIRKTFSF